MACKTPARAKPMNQSFQTPISRLGPAIKGLPPHAPGLPLGDVGRQGWQLLQADLPFPLAVIKSTALNHNLEWMARFCKERGIDIAPHGKTTMSPELYRRQLEAGAWGISFANVQQAGLGIRHGVQRILIANQVFQPKDLEALHTWERSHPLSRVCFLIDSLAQLDLIVKWQHQHPQACFEVLLELGISGKRTGVRSLDQGLALARAIRQSQAVRLVGVECYEGGLATCRSEEDRKAVSALMQVMTELTRACVKEDLFECHEVLMTAGGSAVFDLVAEHLRPLVGRPVRGILRSGCYLTHDHVQYHHHLQAVGQRLGQSQTLLPAIEVLSVVQSVPEPGLALLTMGKRDVSHDLDLPIPLWRTRSGASTASITPCPKDWRITALNDQHAYLQFDPASESLPQVGDIVGSGISHPCTTFDKWRWMPIVDDQYHVVDAISIHF